MTHKFQFHNAREIGVAAIPTRGRIDFDHPVVGPGVQSLVATGTLGGATPRKRGFAAMDPERQREIARLGGKAGGGHRWTSEEASRAGKLRHSKEKRDAKAGE